MELKVKPETVTIEDALIVSLWHDPNLLGVVPHLMERHFPTWGVVFKHIKDAFLNGYRPIISLLPTNLQFPFAELLDKVPPMDEAEVKVAAEQLVKQQTLSLLRRLGKMLMEKASDDADPSYLIGLVSHYIEQTVKGMGLEFKSFPTLVADYLKWLTGAEQDANVVGSFGLPTLDEKIGQLRAGMLVTVLAPTGGGKTSFAVQAALNSALQNHPVAFFSLEMTEEQLMTRMVAHLTSLPSFALWTRRIGSSPDDLKKIEDLRDMGLPIYLARDTWTLDDVLRAIVTAKLRFGCRLVIIDYLQKIIAPQQERRELEVAMVAKELKRYALQQEVAVIALSQVNTEREGRARESRVIEHESDVMLFLKASEFGRVKIEVRKNRMGESGHIIEADFNAELCRFSEETLKVLDQPLPNPPRNEHGNMSSKRLPDALWAPLREITRPDPSEKWQVEGLIKAGNLVILSARPKTAKSIVALNLAACVATGRPFLNRPTQQGRALFVAWERHDLTVQRAFAMGLDACEDFMIWDRHRFGVAPRVDALDWWREFITTNNIRLVVFDTLAHFLRPELDKVRNAISAYDHISGVMERIAQIDNETGCTFVFVHHDRKGEGDTDEQRVLGTTALTAAADVVLQLQPIGDDKGVKMLKATGNAIDDQQLYFVIKGDYWIKVEGRPATTKEEKATKAIEAYLRQHKEATRQELIRHLIESDEVKAGTESAAKKLFYRALDDYLAGKVERKHEGKQVIFRLREELVDTGI